MPFPKRFAGYDSPLVLLRDPALTREQKLSALRSWRTAAERSVADEGLGERRQRLVLDIDRALDAVREH